MLLSVARIDSALLSPCVEFDAASMAALRPLMDLPFFTMERLFQRVPVFLKASNSTADFVGLAVMHTHTRFGLTSPILMFQCFPFIIVSRSTFVMDAISPHANFSSQWIVPTYIFHVHTPCVSFHVLSRTPLLSVPPRVLPQLAVESCAPCKNRVFFSKPC